MMFAFVADKSFVRFCNHSSMADVKAKSIFLHVCIPGQEDNAPDFVGELVLCKLLSKRWNIWQRIYCVCKQNLEDDKTPKK